MMLKDVLKREYNIGLSNKLSHVSIKNKTVYLSSFVV